MIEAQAEIKSTVTVNTSDIAAKAQEDIPGGGVSAAAAAAAGIQHKQLQQINGGGGGLNKKPANGNIVMTEELKEELDEATLATQAAYTAVRGAEPGCPDMLVLPVLEAAELNGTAAGPGPAGHEGDNAANRLLSSLNSFDQNRLKELNRLSSDSQENRLSPKVSVMKPILRFLQLLCENHNRYLQNLLRDQNKKSNFNLVSETLILLDVICGSTTGGLGLLGLYINENNVHLIIQILETLTESCQGPCYENQVCIAMHESNGLGIITALILNDINPLGMTRMDLVLELKNNASKLLLAIMESRTSDSEMNVAEKIIYNLNPKQLLDLACKFYHHQQNLEDEDDDDVNDPADSENVSPRVVGHNIYILIHQLALYNKDIGDLLRPNPHEPLDQKVLEALSFYRSHTAQIEVIRSDRNLEQIVFPIPEICEYLTEETKHKVRVEAELDDQGSKVSDFFERTDYMFDEMRWQKKLRSTPTLFKVSSLMSTWDNYVLFVGIFINVVVAVFYPFSSQLPDVGFHWSLLLWVIFLASGCLAFFTGPQLPSCARKSLVKVVPLLF